jgi:copper chaperone NosL
MRTRATALLWLLLALACSEQRARPVEPVWGKQPCDHCMMLVSEKPPAAQLLLGDGARKFFDDVGCMVAWLAQNGGQHLAAWVRAPGRDGWVDARSVRYGAGQRTPMDYGYLPAARGVSFEELTRAIQQRSAQRGAP